MTHGYEPGRIIDLDDRTRQAIDALAGISSDDPDAARAIDVVGRLRNVLQHDILGATGSIIAVDPLTAAGIVARPRGDDLFSRWRDSIRRILGGTQWSELDDTTLMTMLAIALAELAEAPGLVRSDDPFWTDVFPSLVAEFEHRAATDADFAAMMIEEARTNPLVGSIVAAGAFHDDVVVRVLNSLVDHDDMGIEIDMYFRQPIVDLLETAAADPVLALDVLVFDALTEKLFTWNRDGVSGDEVPESLLADVVSVAFGLPFTDPGRLDDAYEVWADFVVLANGDVYPHGFSPEVSATLGASFTSYLPFMISSFGDGPNFWVKDFDDERITVIGTEEAVLDLVGALLRDPTSRELLLTGITVLSITATSDTFDLDEVTNYVDALIKAAEDERIEEQIKAERDRDEWNITIDTVSGLLDRAFEAAGEKFAPARQALGWITEGAEWLVDLIDADETGIGEVRAVAYMLFAVGLSSAFLEGRDDDPTTDRARSLLERIQRGLRNGDRPDDLEGLIKDIRDEVEDVGGEEFLARLDHPNIAPPPVIPGEDTDTEG